MTEIAEKLFMPTPAAPRYAIDPVAFFIALFAGPLLITLATFWALFIPVAALLIGGPVYLVIGTPLLLFHLQRHPCTPGSVARLACGAVLMLLPAGAVLSLIWNDLHILYLTFWLVGFGLVFGALWAVAFGWIYTNLCRDFHARPHAI